MILGIGTDILEVDRVRKTMEKDPGFKSEVFTSGEIAYCESKANKYQHFAARFCAKEAFLKAISFDKSKGISLREIEVFNDHSGQPFIRLSGVVKDIAVDLGVTKILVSLAHLKEIANAAVLIEREE